MASPSWDAADAEMHDVSPPHCDDPFDFGLLTTDQVTPPAALVPSNFTTPEKIEGLAAASPEGDARRAQGPQAAPAQPVSPGPGVGSVSGVGGGRGVDCGPAKDTLNAAAVEPVDVEADSGVTSPMTCPSQIRTSHCV